MIDIYTIASKPQHIIEECGLSEKIDYQPIFQARPNMSLPIIINGADQPKVVMATWGILNKASGTNTTTIGMQKILGSTPFNVLIRAQRCAVPANCFFTIHNSETYLIRLIKPRLFYLGGLYMKEFNNGKIRYRFALLTTSSADILDTITSKMPVLFTKGHINSWLYSEGLMTVMSFSDTAGNHWFDFFKVNSNILSAGTNGKQLLKPIGMSLHQVRERERMLTSLEFAGERANRKSMKH